jgi:hypothetical protein
MEAIESVEDLSDDNRDDSIDDELARATQLLGPAEAIFRADPRRTRISLTLGVLLIMYSVVANYVWWVHIRGGFGHLEIHFLITPFVIGCGILTFLHHHRGLRVAVFATGILRLRRNDVESVPFDEVTVLRLRTKSATPVIERDANHAIVACHVPIAVPTFRIWEAWVELEHGDEEKAKFRPAVGDFARFAELVQRKLFAVQWPETVERIERGEVIVFDNLLLDRHGLTFGKKSQTWGEVGATKLEATMITIGRRESMWAFWAHEVSSLPNPHLLLALMNWLTPSAAPQLPATNE